MAKKRTNARTRTLSKPKKSGVRARRGVLVARQVARFIAPRTTSQVVTLLFVIMAVATAAGLEIRHLATGSTAVSWKYTWIGVLLLLAIAARLSPRWAPDVDVPSSPLRTDIGAALLVYAALSVCWYAIQGFFPLPTPADHLPGAAAFIAVLAGVAAALLLRLPIGAWGCAAARSVGGGAAGLSAATQGRVAAARARQTLDIREVATLVAEIEDPRIEEPAAVSHDQVAVPAEKPGDPAPPEDPGTRQLLPPIDLFVAPPKTRVAPSDLDYKAQRIRDTLASFKVGARVVGHHSGPVVTQFDVEPDRGVKVRRITELQNDLALALAAPTIRIQAPVPGKPVVGIEIPNTAATMVTFRELIEAENYQTMESPLRVALGKDVAGNTSIIDLAKMPHLLIAGATGSGKSVCVNAIISCLLYNNTPNQVRLMMVDPKMVELTVYNGVPHLLSPVVTEMDKVVGVLQWALREMERRYKLFANNSVRNIARFNEKADEAKTGRLPYIVLIVDELADLMMVAPEDVEDAICRLAQLARAAGIHLVIATQRPSVDVVTGLIKANFPARIAFAMTSQVDSRTILDTVGAEKLLGRGDMLYQPPDAPRPVRLQGAFLSDVEIERLAEFWKESPLQESVERVSKEEFEAAEKESAETRDELIQEAARIVRESRHASVSLLQRRLRVGYSRAARIMDQLEEMGVVGAADGSKQRPVLEEDGPGE